MNDEYQEGFDAAVDHMNYYLERIELKNRQCMELSLLMNMMHNWHNCYELEKNIKFTQEILLEVRNQFYLMRKYG